MGMKKGMLALMLAGVLWLGLSVSKVVASEGVFKLGSVDDSGASCYALSIFQSGRYKVVGTCRELMTPYSAELNRYVLWAIDAEGGSMRIGEVKYGKIEASVSEKFVSLMVTAEEKSTAREPSGSVVVKGDWQAVPLEGELSGKDSRLVVSVTPSPTDEKKAAAEAVVEDGSEQGGVAKFLATVGRIVGIGFLLLLVGVVVMTIVTRRKEQI